MGKTSRPSALEAAGEELPASNPGASVLPAMTVLVVFKKSLRSIVLSLPFDLRSQKRSNKIARRMLPALSTREPASRAIISRHRLFHCNERWVEASPVPLREIMGEHFRSLFIGVVARYFLANSDGLLSRAGGFGAPPERLLSIRAQVASAWMLNKCSSLQILRRREPYFQPAVYLTIG